MDNYQIINKIISDYEIKDGDANQKTIIMLDEIKKNFDNEVFIKINNDTFKLNFFTRLAVGLTQYFSLIDESIKEEELNELLIRRKHIINIYLLSGYGNMRHLIQVISKLKDGKRFLSYKNLYLYFSIMDLDDIPTADLSLLLKFKPESIFRILTGLLSQRAVITENGENNRTKLLSYGVYIQNSKIDEKDLSKIFQPWMYCTYASASHKHDIKKYFNELILNILNPLCINIKQIKYEYKKYPKILVIHENFNSNHAMYRCFADVIKSLKSNFKIVALAENNKIDENSKLIHEEVITIDIKKTPVIEIIKIIQNIKPDIIFYPSVGMNFWTILISNLRLASIQIAGQGHPATTNSKNIDYVICPEFKGTPSEIYSEKLLFINLPGPIFNAKNDLPKILPIKNRLDDGAIHIAVNSKIMKISYRLINVCKKLNKNSKFPLVFHFMPGLRPDEFNGIAVKIKSQLPNAIVHKYLTYSDYLQTLKNCSFTMAGFPFGNTNGTVDACILGVPTVAYSGSDLSSQTDEYVLNIAGYPEWLINHSDEEYYNTALRLINQPKLLNELKEKIDVELTKSRLIRSTQSISNKEFSEFINFVYKNHLKLQSSINNVIRYSDIINSNKSSFSNN